MKAPLYDIVQGLALDIVNASEAENDQMAVEAYRSLKELCDSHKGSDLDHPLQWEALGDFSENNEEALQAYKNGLTCSELLVLTEHSASIKFAMAESYYEQKDILEAHRLALEANSDASNTNDTELKASINEFINELNHS